LVNPRMGLNNIDLNADMMPTDLGVDRCDGGKIRNLMLSFANRYSFILLKRKWYLCIVFTNTQNHDFL